MSEPILYITGTNTGVGKTTLADQLLRRARERKIIAAAMKPFCSGGREDAEQLHALQSAGLTLDQVNPFHFDEPLTPLIAARHAGRAISLDETLAGLSVIRERHCPALVEGAGGLLSPLGEGFSLHNIIQRAPGLVCVVAPNSLGVLNSVLLTVHRLEMPPQNLAIVLMAPAEPDRSSETNFALLSEFVRGALVTEFPRLGQDDEAIPAVDTLLNWWTSGNPLSG